MSKKIIMLTVLVLALTLSACERSASSGTQATPTATGAAAQPTSSDPMEMLRGFATQTALAMSGGAPQATVSTPAPGITLPAASGTPGFGYTMVVPTVTSAPATAVPANNVRPLTYTLQEGEYPYCIARRFDVNPDELLSLNGLTGGGMYVPGLVLKIPQSGSFPGPRSLLPRPASYTVMSGDSIYKIACKYGDIDPLVIASANSLVAPYTLTSGKVITIP